jgi:hypothetical protein
MKLVLPVVVMVVLGLGLMTYQLRAPGAAGQTAPGPATTGRTTQPLPTADPARRGVPLEPQPPMGTTGAPGAPGAVGATAPRLAPEPGRGTTAPGAAGGTGGTAQTAPATQEVVLQYDQAALTRDAQANLVGQRVASTPLGDATVQSVQVQLGNNQVMASGQAQVGGFSVPYTITGTVSVQQGRPRVQVSDARAGGFNLPQDSIAGIEQSLQAQIEQMLAQERLRLQSIAIRPGVMIITGTRQ